MNKTGNLLNSNNYKEFYFMEIWIIFFVDQEHRNNNTKSEELAYQTFF